MPDFDQFQVASGLQPLPTSSANGSLQDADGSLFYALDFWAWVINTYPGPRLVQELSIGGITAAINQRIDKAVAESYPYEPVPEQLESQFRFPFLAAYRKETQTEHFTIGHETDSTSLEVLYVLPPLDAAGSERVLPLLNSVLHALRRKTTDGWDPGYAPPGGNPGDQPWSAAYANVEAIGFGEDRDYAQGKLSRMATFGYLSSGSSLYFPCLRMQAYVRERDMYAPTQGGPSKFAGADIIGNVLATDGTKVLAVDSNVVRVSTQPGPVISNLSVATGTSLGGTVFDLTGANFKPGPPTVFFGPATNPQYAAGVVFLDSGALLVTTPAMQGAGTVDVTVRNLDQQSFTLPRAFTFV